MKKESSRGCSYVLYDFMGERLGLSGNSLLTFAIIYSFSHDGRGFFLGSQEYIARKICANVRSIGRALKQLEEQEYITKLPADTKCRVCYRVAERFFDDNIDRTLEEMPVLCGEEQELKGELVGRYPEDGRVPKWLPNAPKWPPNAPKWPPPTTNRPISTDKLTDRTGRNVGAGTTKSQCDSDKLSDNNKPNNILNNELYNKLYNAINNRAYNIRSASEEI